MPRKMEIRRLFFEKKDCYRICSIKFVLNLIPGVFYLTVSIVRASN